MNIVSGFLRDKTPNSTEACTNTMETGILPVCSVTLSLLLQGVHATEACIDTDMPVADLLPQTEDRLWRYIDSYGW